MIFIIYELNFLILLILFNYFISIACDKMKTRQKRKLNVFL